jgi:hypothetical protein
MESFKTTMPSFVCSNLVFTGGQGGGTEGHKQTNKLFSFVTGLYVLTYLITY